ncbi:MAG TPA: DNA primase [Gaiellaceae bacterium]|nr:DNA primase [Gaiellaceae bacterium]
MARIKDESVEAVKSAASIVDLVEARIRLRKVGGRYTGLCPFHEEKTPSFSVSPDRGTYHCFGCGVGGDAISFVRETESLDFVGAIEWLADRFHVPIEYEESSPRADAERKRRDRLRELLEQAAAYYERVLWDSKLGEPVRSYLESRGLGEETCREFRLGLSPQGATLAGKAREKFSADELASAGLVTRRGNDYFQRRLMFPLADARGRVIGFQARKLHEDDPLRGKYVNSPEGELFRKSNVLYGLHLARGAISKEDRAVVVEGNTDVIALRQAGLHSAVASMGTALTERQLKELTRLTTRVYLCFDSDSAGEDATLRGMELAIRQGLDVRVVALPRGKDPADDPTGFEERLTQADPYAVHRVRLELARARDRQHAYLQVQEVLNGIPESPERHDAWRLANDRLGLTVELRAVAGGTASAGRAVSPRIVDAGEKLERNALAGVRAHAGLLRVLAELGPEHFDSEQHRRIREILVTDETPELELVPVLAELDAVAERDGIDEETAKQLLLRLRERHLRREFEGADDAQLSELQHKLAEIRTAIREFA